jgi:hypothetical protein
VVEPSLGSYAKLFAIIQSLSQSGNFHNGQICRCIPPTMYRVGLSADLLPDRESGPRSLFDGAIFKRTADVFDQ